MSRQTPLYQAHLAAGAKMVDFAGWDMPIHYGSQLQEHLTVRQDAGMFDVSHMTIIDIKGKNVKAFLRYLLANDIAKLTQSGKALYSCMLNPNGGVIDDLIVYYLSDDFYRLVVNAGTREKDLTWIRQQAKTYDLDIQERVDCAMIAIQGPQARVKVHSLLNETQQAQCAALKLFQAIQCDDLFIARTGYTGEEGYEIILPATLATTFWQQLIAAGIKPCGLGARDTLRLEAGLNLYGADMDDTTSPLESNLAWTIAFTPEDRNFIGRDALIKQKQHGVTKCLVGLLLEEKGGVLRSHQKVIVNNNSEGEITSGTFSPSLNRSIALARVPVNFGTHCQVQIRDKLLTVRVIKPPFVRYGKAVFE